MSTMKGRPAYAHGAEAQRRINAASDWGLPPAALVSEVLSDAGLKLGRSSCQTMINAAKAAHPLAASSRRSTEIGTSIVRNGVVPDTAPPMSFRALLGALLALDLEPSLAESLRWHFKPESSDD
jgi:hypothetical protein